MKVGEVYTFNGGQTIDVICKINKIDNGYKYWYQIFVMKDILDDKGKVVLSGGGSCCDLEYMDDDKWEACAFAHDKDYKFLGIMNKDWGINKFFRLTNNKEEFAHKWNPRE